jgi:hypothetical protein
VDKRRLINYSKRETHPMSETVLLLIVIGIWIALQVWILPRFGVST